VSLTFSFEPPDKVFSINEKPHWSIAASMKSSWRSAGAVYGRKARIDAKLPRPSFTDGVRVQVFLPFRTERRRDAHNYTGTVVKALIDGMRDAGLFPDDTPEYVTVMDPILDVGGPYLVTVEVTRTADPAG
jgi:hypothetical protein